MEELSEVEIVDGEVETLPAVRASQAIIARDEITVAEIVAQREKIVQVMDAVMTRDVHYGIIPGVKNPSLFKPGAETLCVALRLAPHYISEKIWHDDGHLTVSVLCTLKHIPTGLEIATGEGLCSTKEQRYAYRTGERVCPACSEPAIIKGKEEYGGGWVCFKKKGGCGAKFNDGDPAIESQTTGKVANPDIPDSYNTVLKMADKRALIAAVLNGTAASDVFTQDVEDGTTAGVSHSGERAPEVRVEGPKDLPVPKTWAKVTEYVSAYDEGTHDLFMAFAQSARKLQFGTTDKKEMSADDRATELSVAGRAAWKLRDSVDSTAFPPPTIEDIRKAWAAVLGGQELAIPGEE
jgi:hypothetical protein